MLVIDLDALKTVDLLDFVEQVLLKLLGSADIEDLMRDDGTFSELLALLHEVTLEGDDMLGERNEVLFFGSGLRITDDELALATDRSTNVDDAVDAGDLAGILWTASFEELGDTRQTAGDVLGLGDLTRSLGQTLTGLDFFAFLALKVSSSGNGVAGHDLFLVIDDDNLRMEIVLVLNKHCAHDAGLVVNLLADGDAGNHVAEFDLT